MEIHDRKAQARWSACKMQVALPPHVMPHLIRAHLERCEKHSDTFTGINSKPSKQSKPAAAAAAARRRQRRRSAEAASK